MEQEEKILENQNETENLSEIENDSPSEINHSNIPVLQQLGVALSVLLLIFGMTYIDDINSFLTPTEISDTQKMQAETFETFPKKTNVENNYFENTSIDAQSAFVWDIQTQKALYNHNADAQLPLASITKLMTALVAHELLENNSEITINLDAIFQAGDSGLIEGEKFTLESLSDLTLLTSSNDGAFALAASVGLALKTDTAGEQTFVDIMNIRASEIGLSQTYFKNPTGLDLSDSKSGSYSSARDVTFLMEYIMTHYPSILEITRKENAFIYNSENQYHEAENTNSIVAEIPGLLSSKTGYTDLAGGNLVISYDAGLNRPIVITVLGSTRNGRFTDVLQLVEASRKSIIKN